MFALLSVVYADDLVLYRGAPAQAAAILSPLVPAWELDLQEIDALYPREGVRVLGAEAQGCSGPASTSAGVRDAVTMAEGRLNYAEYGKALETLRPGIAALGCLGEPAEASVAGRMFLLAGIAAYGAGEEAEAAAAFRRAQHFQPGLPYDERLPPVAQDLYREVAGEGLRTRLWVSGVTAPIWLDGRVMQPGAEGTELAAGTHLIQILGDPIQTMQVDLIGEAALLGALSGDLRGAAWSTPARLWDGIAAALRGAGADTGTGGERVFVVNEGHVWQGPGDWVAVKGGAEAQAPRRAGGLPTGLIASGLTATAVGGGTFLAGRLWGAAHREDATAGGSEDYWQLQGAYGMSRVWSGGGGVVGLIGLGLTGAGVALQIHAAQVQVQVTPLSPAGGAALAITGRY